MTGAPNGMSMTTAGAVTGVHRYSANIQLRLLSKTQCPVSAVLVSTITIVNPPAPIVTAQAISGKVGTALSFTPQVTASNPVGYSMTGAPSGMSIATTGVVSWANPVLGNYTVTVVAKRQCDWQVDKQVLPLASPTHQRQALQHNP